jgi:hypothetical protein
MTGVETGRGGVAGGDSYPRRRDRQPDRNQRSPQRARPSFFPLPAGWYASHSAPHPVGRPQTESADGATDEGARFAVGQYHHVERTEPKDRHRGHEEDNPVRVPTNHRRPASLLRWERPRGTPIGRHQLPPLASVYLSLCLSWGHRRGHLHRPSPAPSRPRKERLATASVNSVKRDETVGIPDASPRPRRCPAPPSADACERERGSCPWSVSGHGRRMV